MLIRQYKRRDLALSILTASFTASSVQAAGWPSRRISILDHGALPDAVTINTTAIQKAIDHLAAQGGGTVVVPQGVFVSGALFLKPKVSLHLEQGAVLRCSIDVETNFPVQRTRIEGHFEEKFTPALINAKRCDNLKITGEGTLDGAGRPIWDRFWALQRAATDPSNFPNLGVPRARLAIIENSKQVTIEGVTFKDSQYWNLHLYRCEDVLVRRARFEVPDDYKQAPSTDGIDLDSCRKVVIDGCYFSVTDDCIAAKGSKGLRALEDKDSPPVEAIRVRNCHFRRGHHAFACGSEATIVRDVIVENCKITGSMVLARLKLRMDTPQHYEKIRFRNITMDSGGGSIIAATPWVQYNALKGEMPPKSVVRDISFSGIKGRFGAFGTIQPNLGQTAISDILFKNVDISLTRDKLMTSGVSNLRFRNVVVNGKLVSG